MKRLFVALVLLLMSFLSTLAPLQGLRGLAVGAPHAGPRGAHPSPDRVGASAQRDACGTPVGASRRRSDHGSELLVGSWATESAKDRAALLDALTTGLSLADEELLERALDDSSRVVRQRAAGLLAG